MKGVLARKHIELPLKNALVTKVTHLLRVYRDICIPLFPLFLSKFLTALGVNFQILLQVLDLDVVLIKAETQVLLHVFY